MFPYLAYLLTLPWPVTDETHPFRRAAGRPESVNKNITIINQSPCCQSHAVCFCPACFCPDVVSAAPAKGIFTRGGSAEKGGWWAVQKTLAQGT